MTDTVTSADGTAIAFDRLGAGPPLIMAAGAFNTRTATAPLAGALQDRFTVLNYDRRGRGESGDTAPYAVERELEDLAALIGAAGGTAAVFGYSSGANLALAAAAQGLGITALALYEPAFRLDGGPRPPAGLPGQLAELVRAGRRGAAVELFQARVIGMPEAVIAGMRRAPFRPALEAIAHTLAYEAALVGDLTLPRAMLGTVEVETLVLDGSESAPAMRDAAQAVAGALPRGRHHRLAGQSHDLSPAATAPVVADFLSG
jgi:pimeloyl-ACP methyl ester carboxylesterase